MSVSVFHLAFTPSTKCDDHQRAECALMRPWNGLQVITLGGFFIGHTCELIHKWIPAHIQPDDDRALDEQLGR